MKTLYRIGLFSFICVSMLFMGRGSPLYSQSDPVHFPARAPQWWLEVKHPTISSQTREFIDEQSSHCDDFPGNPPSPEWWAVTWEAYFDNNYEIVYQNWCDGFVRLTNNSNSDFSPHFSPSGTQIVFISNRDGNRELYVMQSDGSQQQRLTNNPLSDVSPDWSSTNRIVFASGSDTVDSEIWTMNPDGSAQSQLTSNDLYDEFPTWTADGGQIFWERISADGKSGELWRMNSDGSNPTRISTPLPYLAEPKISPDGQQIIAEADIASDGPYDLIILNSDGSNLRTLKSSNFDRNNPPNEVEEYLAGGWLADNSGILYLTLHYRLNGNKYQLERSHINTLCFDTSRCTDKGFSASSYNFSPDVVNRDPFPPTSKMLPLPEYSVVPDLRLLWSAKDEGVSGLSRFNLEYQTENMSAWAAFPGYENGGTDFSGQLNLQVLEPGKVSFRIRAVDNAANQEQFPANEAAEATTTMIAGWLEGRLTDNRGVPYGLKPIDVQPSAVVTGLTTTNGEFVLPVFNFDPFTINDRWHVKTGALLSDLYVMPEDSIIKDGGFAEQSQPDWQLFRTQPLRLEPVVGEQSLGLSKVCLDGPCIERSGIMTDGEVSMLPIVASASQSVTIPFTMTKPTLSFLYRIRSGEPITSYFGITVDSEITESVEISSTPPISNVLVSSLLTSTITTTQVFSQSEASDWALGWIDMSHWTGQSITVTFAAYEAEGVENIQVYLDEVSLGSWKTPFPKDISPLKVDYGASVTLTITGENFIDLPIVKLNGIVITEVVKIDDATLEVTIPENFAPGIYYVQVINPQGQDAIAPQLFAVGKQTYLPLIAR